MIGAAIVGLGWWGRHIVSTLQDRSESLRFVRGVDPRTDQLSEFAGGHQIRLTANIEDVLGDPGVQAVVLATPHSLHETQIVQSAAAGKHVFCEKPLALSRASAERAIRALPGLARQ